MLSFASRSRPALVSAQLGTRSSDSDTVTEQSPPRFTAQHRDKEGVKLHVKKVYSDNGVVVPFNLNFATRWR